jgi:hypothetical protein
VAEQAAPYLTGPDQGSWLARLDTDQANLRRAAQYAAGRPDGTALVLRLGVALGRYWGARSQQQEAFRLLVPVLRRSDARANPALLGPALVTAAAVACFIDDATARQLAEQAVQVARQLGDERLLSRALAAVCGAHFFSGEPETGRPFGQESVERARRLGDDVQLAQSLLTYLMTIDPARSGQLHCTASRRPSGTGPAIRGKYLRRMTAGTAWTKRVHTWAMSGWSGSTPRAWRSASRRPSTWPCQERARPDRYRRETVIASGAS